MFGFLLVYGELELQNMLVFVHSEIAMLFSDPLGLAVRAQRLLTVNMGITRLI